MTIHNTSKYIIMPYVYMPLAPNLSMKYYLYIYMRTEYNGQCEGWANLWLLVLVGIC